MRKMVLTLTLCSLFVGGCSYLHPYQVDIQQGRKLEQSKLKKLHHGMSKAQVAQLLGKPLLKDPLHKNRWTYTYYHRPEIGPTELKRLIIYFDNGAVKTIASDYEH
jgi:outer membrane protein assembly factor BamE